MWAFLAEKAVEIQGGNFNARKGNLSNLYIDEDPAAVAFSLVVMARTGPSDGGERVFTIEIIDAESHDVLKSWDHTMSLKERSGDGLLIANLTLGVIAVGRYILRIATDLGDQTRTPFRVALKE